MLDVLPAWPPCTRARPPMADARPNSTPRAAPLPAPPNMNARASPRIPHSLSPFLELSLYARTLERSHHGRVRHGRAGRRRVPTISSSHASYRVFHHLLRRAPPLLRPFSGHLDHRGAVAAEQSPALRLLARPASHRPPPSMSQPPGGTPGSSSAGAYSSTLPVPPQPAGAMSRLLPCVAVERKKKVDHVRK